MRNEPIHSTLSNRDEEALKAILKNAERVLEARPGNSEAIQLREAALEEWTKRHPTVINGWTPGTQGDPRILMWNGIAVASVHRLETHKRKNHGVYKCIVRGRELSGLFRHVDDAREAANIEILRA